MGSQESVKVRFAPRGFMPLPDDKYPAAVFNVHERVTKYGDSINIIFEITEGKYRGRQIGKYLKVGRAGDALWQWIEVLTKTRCDDLNEHDLTSLIGKRCLIGVENKNRIYDIFPLENQSEHT